MAIAEWQTTLERLVAAIVNKEIIIPTKDFVWPSRAEQRPDIMLVFV